MEVGTALGEPHREVLSPPWDGAGITGVTRIHPLRDFVIQVELGSCSQGTSCTHRSWSMAGTEPEPERALGCPHGRGDRDAPGTEQRGREGGSDLLQGSREGKEPEQGRRRAGLEG